MISANIERWALIRERVELLWVRKRKLTSDRRLVRQDESCTCVGENKFTRIFIIRLSCDFFEV